MSSLRALSLLAVALQLSSVVEAHVRLLYTGTSIRNAAGAATDGAYSVSGPCGGQQTFGKNGIKQVQAGQTLPLKIAYNGGHPDPANVFRVAMTCTAAGGTPPTSDQAMRGTTMTNSPTIAAPTASTAGYSLNVNLPQQAAGSKCTLSVLDQRQWGGCVDLQYAAAPTQAGPTGPPTTTIAPTTPNLYLGDAISGLWTVADQCLDTVANCCCMGGTMQVQHASGSKVATITAALSGKQGQDASCPMSASISAQVTGNDFGVWGADGLSSGTGDVFQFQGENKADAQWSLTNTGDNIKLCSLALYKGATTGTPFIPASVSPTGQPGSTTPAATLPPSGDDSTTLAPAPTARRPVNSAASVSASSALMLLVAAVAALFRAH